jgi:two-component system sensor histidine kinase MprB
MSLRTRVTLAAGGAVFVALLVASLVIYFSVRTNLRDQIDASLIENAQNVGIKTANSGRAGQKLPQGVFQKNRNPSFPQTPLLGTTPLGYFQVIASYGAIAKESGNPALLRPKGSGAKPDVLAEVANPNSFIPLVAADQLVATGGAPPYFRDVRYQGTPMRVYTMRYQGSTDGLVRTARPLSEANATITNVRWLLLALTVGGALAAALLGRLAAAAILRPVRTLATAVRDVTATRDLKRRIEVDSTDEVGSLARDFNEMLAALEESQRTQQQLIADASHELRTPLTAHRANIELLARPDLPPDRRPHVLTAAVRGIDELGTLISDLIQAARNGRTVDAREPVRLDKLVERAVERARRGAPQVQFELRLEPSTVSGSATRVERAVDNVLDNAIKWSPGGATIEVAVEAGTLTVRDHGPGIDESDLPHVFDRFYRSAAARGMPGSGLGLAIVKQTLDDHGGTVTVANADGGGTVVSLGFETLTNP